jgi:hypothetical protein
VGPLSLHPAEPVSVHAGRNSGTDYLMSQNRQDAKDRVRSELDYERRAAAEIQGLARKLNLPGEQICDLENLIRNKPIAR